MVKTVKHTSIERELCYKVDKALSMGFSAELIGAALMIEEGLDPGPVPGPIPLSLDSLLHAGMR